jgi:hypothetical protein
MLASSMRTVDAILASRCLVLSGSREHFRLDGGKRARVPMV